MSNWKLINPENIEVKRNVYVDNDGNIFKEHAEGLHKILTFTPPRHSGSTGRVCVEDGKNFVCEYFPGVFKLKFIEEEE